MIVVSDSSPIVTLARAEQLDLLHAFYGKVVIPREVYNEVAVAGTGLPGAEEVRRASWIQVMAEPLKENADIITACAGLGPGERSAIYLASSLRADVVLIDEERARRAAKAVGLSVAGSIAMLERGAWLGKVADLRAVYQSLVEQGIRFDRRLLNDSLVRLGVAKL